MGSFTVMHIVNKPAIVKSYIMKNNITFGKYIAPRSTGFSVMSCVKTGCVSCYVSVPFPCAFGHFLHAVSEIPLNFVNMAKSLRKWLLFGLSEQKRVRIRHISSPYVRFTGEHSVSHWFFCKSNCVLCHPSTLHIFCYSTLAWEPKWSQQI